MVGDMYAGGGMDINCDLYVILGKIRKWFSICDKYEPIYMPLLLVLGME
jgi:hypothetical protein